MVLARVARSVQLVCVCALDQDSLPFVLQEMTSIMRAGHEEDASDDIPCLGPGLKTFVINLTRRPDRRSHIEELCRSLELDCEFIEAVDGKVLAALPQSSFEVVRGTLKSKQGSPIQRSKESRSSPASTEGAASPSSGSSIPARGFKGLSCKTYGMEQ